MGPGVAGITSASNAGPQAPPGRWRRATRLLSGEVARKGYLSGLDQALISLTNFVVSILLARSLTPTQFGAYGVGFLLLYLGRAFQEGLVVQPMTSLAPGLQGEPQRRYLTGTAGIQIGLAATEAAACAVFGWLLTSWGNTVAGPTLFALWLPLLLAQPQEYVRRVFYTLNRVDIAVLNTTVSSAVRILATVWLLAAGGEQGTVGLSAIGLGAAAGLTLGIVETRGLWLRRGVHLKEIWRRNWTFGRWVLGSTVANWIAVDVYPVLTAGLVSFAATGAYRALQNIVAPIHSLLRAMDTYFTPRLAERRRLAGAAGVVHMVRRMFLVTGPPVGLVLLVAVSFAEPLLELLYGPTYLEYAGGMRLMAVFYALLYSYWPIQSALKALERTRAIFVGSLAAMAAMATVGVWAILRWEVYGTIAGQALSAGLLAVVLWSSWLRWLKGNRASLRAAPSVAAEDSGTGPH